MPRKGCSTPRCHVSFLLRIPLHPVLGILLELLAVLLVLVCDRRLNRIVNIRLNQQRLDEAQHGNDLVWRLPLIGPKQSQAHGAFVVVAHVGVVDFRSEADDRGLEWVLVGEVDLELEMAALSHPSAGSCESF